MLPSNLILTAVVFACLLLEANVFAQSGIVKSNGLAVPGATVTAIQNGKSISTTTDETGRYEFAGLAPGSYAFEVRMFGFRVERKEAQIPGQQLDWTLQIMQRPDAAALRTQTGQANQAQTEIANEIAAAGAGSPPGVDGASANDAFLVNGSLSQGLQNGQPDAVLPQGRGFGGQFPGDRQPGLMPDTQNIPGTPGGPGGPVPGQGGGFGAGGRGGAEGLAVEDLADGAAAGRAVLVDRIAATRATAASSAIARAADATLRCTARFSFSTEIRRWTRRLSRSARAAYRNRNSIPAASA